MQIKIAGLVLAAGKGTRMKSTLPKVLHSVAGISMLQRVVDILAQAGIERVNVLLGGDLQPFEDFLQQNPRVSVVRQVNRLGTGDAVAAGGVGFAGVALPHFAAGELMRGDQIVATHVLVCAGDTPLLSPATLKDFCKSCIESAARLGVLGMRHPEPFGYGRMILDASQRVVAIVEEKDATEPVRKINLCNTGVIFAELKYLYDLLGEIDCNNAQKEFLLTDVVAVAAKRGQPALAYVSDDWELFQGINDPQQLAAVESFLRKQS